MTGLNHIPFIAVPTTSGTGSESTLVAVIKNEARRLKMEFISYYLQPDAAVLDERMTETLPPRMTASTGMDALCHAIEAYTLYSEESAKRRVCGGCHPSDRRQSGACSDKRKRQKGAPCHGKCIHDGGRGIFKQHGRRDTCRRSCARRCLPGSARGCDDDPAAARHGI